MRKYTYRPISEAPKDGTPIVGVCGGVEMAIGWADPLPGILDAGWFYWDEDEGTESLEAVRDDVTQWRELF